MKAINKKTPTAKISTFAAVFLVLIAFLSSCSRSADFQAVNTANSEKTSESNAYASFDIKRTVFIGDSNIYHLKTYGLLPAEQIITGKECYMTLEPSVCEKYVVLPTSNEEIKISDAISKLKPEFIIITLGTDGAYTLDREGFRLSYTQLLDSIISASPDTVIGVQSIFPVCEGTREVRFKNVEKTNSKFKLANQWLREIAKEYKIVYFDTASVLSDESGSLLAEFNTDHLDGYHLNRRGLQVMLDYIQNHVH